MNSMATLFTNLLGPCVFSTKTCAGSGFGIKKRLFPYIGGIIRELGSRRSYQWPADHVHILALLPAKAGQSQTILAK